MKRFYAMTAMMFIALSAAAFATDYYITWPYTVTGTQTIPSVDRWFISTGGSLTVTATGTLNVQGQLIITSGRTAVIDGALVIQSGGIYTQMSSATLQINNQMTVENGGTANLSPLSTSTVAGTLQIQTGGTMNSSGTFTVNSGGLCSVRGTLNIQGGSTASTTGTTEAIYGGTINVTGTFTIQPYGYINIYDYSFVNIQPKGHIVLATGLSILRLWDYATLNLLSAAPNIARLTINDRAIVNIYGTDGAINIDAGSYVTFGGTSCQLAISSWGSGLVTTNESRPFRGTGRLHRIHVAFNNDFYITAADHLEFVFGSSFTFATGRTNHMYVDGYAEFRGVSAYETSSFDANLADINVSSGATFFVKELVSMGAVPNLLGSANSTIQFKGLDTLAMHVEFLPNCQLHTYGTFTSSHTVFHGPLQPGWQGIKIEGPNALIDMSYGGIFDAGIGGYPALELLDASNTANMIRVIDIVTPLFPPAYAGKGIWLHHVTPGSNSRLIVQCSHIHGFTHGVYNDAGYLALYEMKIGGNYTGLYANAAQTYASSVCINGSLDKGVLVEGVPLGTGFEMVNCNIIGNQNIQLELQNGANAFISNSSIYYELGNTTTCLVLANGSSIANVINNWWGVYPTTPMMFNAILPSIIAYAPELTAEPYVDCSCSLYPKSIADHAVIPTAVTVSNFPNPFNPSTVIEYTLPTESPVLLKVYSITGEEVATLVDKTEYAGTHRTTFTAPKTCASGVYLYELTTNQGTIQGRMMLTK